MEWTFYEQANMSTSSYIKTVNSASAKRGIILTALEGVLTGAQQVLVQSKWTLFQSFAKSTVLGLLKNISRGHLIIDSLDETFEFGQPHVLTIDGVSRELLARIKVLDEGFWVRLFLAADLGFADAFMLEEITVDNLGNVFKIFILNRKSISEMSTVVSLFVRTLSYIANLRFSNGVSASQSNISAHYDLSNDLFAGFLSRDMTYSCAIFDEEAKGSYGDLIEARPIAPPRTHYSAPRSIPADDLERGQLAKLRLVAERARIQKGSRVLDVGCGWGSFAILAAGTYGATVEAITISVEQKAAADENIRAAGLSHAINVYVMDYRNLPPSFYHAFDAVVSIGVMEHVGVEFMDEWFRKMAWAMKPEDSFKVFTVSTIPDTRWSSYVTEVDFIRKYIYPGAQLSSVKTLANAITSAGLNIESIENIGPHYARTLREWGYRFENNFETHIRPALTKQYPDLSDADIEIFRWKWIYYFAYCEAGFTMRSISDHVFTTTREANLRI
ncbi:hypothetical protein PLICRDRAFT_146549 [Plicaturopsis crispa FD-325 SS-3]|uniref:Cyclopropane-fatty-acyl-phospholipid synthase n=1 Tax=Plicaturopsis crispa FD-325 SS-3 TaxID=944288 RepID=A0A0C9T9L1_PLICR|nr:hypothetical protein PLICRDRAFT_146549 [Plicaturopsis crispa FD-325 SS-3]